MKIYTINLCTDTKNTDRYDKVAVNKFPIIMKCCDVDELKKYLGNEETANYVKSMLKQKHLYETAVFYIREVDGNSINELTLSVVDLMEINY